LTIGDTKILIDAGPDLRQQALRYGIDHVDGLVLTHVHFDHTAGIDELRSYYFQTRQPMPCLASVFTADDLTHRCSYLFAEPEEGKSLTAQIKFQLLHGPSGAVNFLGINTRYVSYEQGGMPVNGYRWGNFAYISDIKDYPENIFEELAGVEVLVLSALREEPTFVQFTVDEALQFAERVGAKEVYLTHMAHDLEYDALNARLPPHVHCGYDGLQFSFTAERWQ
jgi:phosphoribosyl 1,2-cyclic phosphate phosphodiesterase